MEYAQLHDMNQTRYMSKTAETIFCAFSITRTLIFFAIFQSFANYLHNSVTLVE